MNARFLACCALVGAACQTGVPLTESASAAPAPRVAGAPAATPMQMIADDRPAPADVVAPFTLTASDGSGLRLDRIDARAVVEGPLAYTELHLYFHNAEDRTREGTFTITLPGGAAVSRFAMEHEGRWQEAEVVEKMKARRVYEDFLHRKQDPALLERSAGNQFSARVFPIAGRADKHLVLSFSQELVGRGYRLPLRGLPTVGRVSVELEVVALDGTRRRETLRERDWQPDRDFTAAAPSGAAAVMSGEMMVGAFALADRGAMAPEIPDVPSRLTIAVDTSASRALGYQAYVASVRALIAALRARHGDPLVLQVIAFDQDTELIFDGLAAAYGDAQDRALLARRAAGASDLSQLVARLASPTRPAHRRVVVITDGVVTAGAETPALTAAIARLPIERLDVVLTGGIRDPQLAAAVVRAGLPRAGEVFDLDDGSVAVAAALGERVRTDVVIDIPGAAWVYPRTVPAMRSGGSVLVHARLKAPAASFELVIGGVKRTIVPAAATPALVQRSVTGAEIAEMEARLATITDDGAAKALRTAIAQRSVRGRVLSTQTSMLVLESEADYVRYQIDRTALADILVVGKHGIEVQQRTRGAGPPPTRLATARPAPPTPADRAQALDDARNAGVLGSSATASGGPFASLTGNGDISSGFDDVDVTGGLEDTAPEDAPGGFGFGRSGFGPGGGGSGSGTVGVGRHGTIGRGSGGTGTGSGYGVGSGSGGMRGRSARVPAVRIGVPVVTGELDKAIIRRYIRRHLPRIQYCYEKVLVTKPTLAGSVSTRFTITGGGAVTAAAATGLDPAVADCITAVLRDIQFPSARGAGSVQVSYPFTFSPAGDEPTTPPPPPRAPTGFDVPDDGDGSDDDEPADRSGPALTGKLDDVMQALRAKKLDHALSLARAWHDSAPGDVLALIALGEALEARKDTARAARIYGSIIDLFPARADLRRFAGERLERLGAPARALAVDTYRRAVADRPDHPSGRRLLAYALLRNGDTAGAFAAILAAVEHGARMDRFPGVNRILEEDAGIIAAVHVAGGARRDVVAAALARHGLTIATERSTRFVMYWETDANDVDFHIRDARGGHAWYEHQTLRSGGELYADVTTGYGPECFTIPGRPTAGPYKLSINYYSQGPMGYGMGLLQIMRFDGKAVTFDDRPYVIMTDRAFVDLGTYR